jgi:hypothetical protein
LLIRVACVRLTLIVKMAAAGGAMAEGHRRMAGFEAAEVAVAGFEDCADVARVMADVAALAGSPRGSGHHPGEMAVAQEYVAAGLGQAGWRVTRAPFERRWVIGVTDAGGRQLLPRRVFRRLSGVNLLAELPGAPAGGGVLIVAHLDSVACSPGADDNASGVAALLECARLLAGLPQAPPVRLAVVDLEELACVGSRVLAGEPWKRWVPSWMHRARSGWAGWG